MSSRSRSPNSARLLLLEPLFRFAMSLLSMLERLRGMFKRQLGLFMGTPVIAFTVLCDRTAVSMRREFMKFGGPAVGIVHVSYLLSILGSPNLVPGSRARAVSWTR